MAASRSRDRRIAPLIPGYLNILLLARSCWTPPRAALSHVPFFRVTLLIARYNEEGSIA